MATLCGLGLGVRFFGVRVQIRVGARVSVRYRVRVWIMIGVRVVAAV